MLIMKGKKSVSTINLLLVIQLIIMVILFFLITLTISRSTRQNSLDHMGTITDERAHIIDSYVENAEKTLTYYSKAGQIRDLLKNPTDPQAIAAAQKYTEDFSKDIDNLEGIYVSEWNTHVLAHTNPDVVGMITRPVENGDDTRLRELQYAMLDAGNGVYDTGIIISPASQKQIVSMYKDVYDSNQKPIGLVGLGIFTDELVETLDSMPIRGINNSFYSMINASDKKYIFNVDKSKISTETESDILIALCNKYRGTHKDVTGSFEYSSNGKQYVSTYTYMSDHGWLLMIDDTKNEVFSLTRNMRIYLSIFGLSVLGLMLLFHFINKRQQATADRLNSVEAKNQKTKESLNKAVFKDILTESNNRVAFSMDMDKLDISDQKPYYFSMFNVRDFSRINTQYGNDAGDSVLVSTVAIIKEKFKYGTIYRTGSDEFVVVTPSDNIPNENHVMITRMQEALAELKRPRSAPNCMIDVDYKSALIKASSNIDTSIITMLKDLAERSIQEENVVQFIDLE